MEVTYTEPVMIWSSRNGIWTLWERGASDGRISYSLENERTYERQSIMRHQNGVVAYDHVYSVPKYVQSWMDRIVRFVP